MPDMEIIRDAEIRRQKYQAEMWGLVDGEWRYLFSWYEDELTFKPCDVVGMTPDHARDLFHERDVAWLRS